jgi:hypothetical protein
MPRLVPIAILALALGVAVAAALDFLDRPALTSAALAQPADVQCDLQRNPPPPIVGAALDAVRAIYGREIRIHLARGSEATEDYLCVYTRRTQQAWAASLKGPGPNTEGPILHPLFGWGVLPGSPVEMIDLRTLADDGSHARLEIVLRLRGETHRVNVSAQMSDGAWRIDDLSYDQGEAFRSYLLRCAVGPC